MVYYDPSFEARRNRIIGGEKQVTSGATPQQAQQTRVSTSSFSDPAFEKRRERILNAPQPRIESQPFQISQTVSQPPVQQKSLIAKAGDAFKSLGSLDFGRIKEAFKAGAKQVPGQVKQAGGIIAQNFVQQNRGIKEFFNKTTENKVAAQVLKQTPFVGGAFKVGEFATKNKPVSQAIDTGLSKVESGGAQLREQGFQEQKKQFEEYRAKTTPATGVQKYAELVAQNLPQMATTTGLSLATAILTKNPAAATAVGLSTSYGMGASEIYNDARQFGLSDSEALPLAQVGGAIVGAIDFLPLSDLIEKTGAEEPIKRSIIQNISKGIISAGTQASFEGVTEALQEIIGNALAKTYDENQDLFEGTKESFITALLTGGLADVTLGGVMSVLGNNASPEQVTTDVEERINTALDTEPSKRTPEQQQIVESLLTQELTPDQALSYVIQNELGNTPEGKEIVKLVAQAKPSGQNILIKPNETQTEIQASVVEPGTIDQQAAQKRQELLSQQSTEQKPKTTEIQPTKKTETQVEQQVTEQPVSLKSEVAKYKTAEEFVKAFQEKTAFDAPSTPEQRTLFNDFLQYSQTPEVQKLYDSGVSNSDILKNFYKEQVAANEAQAAKEKNVSTKTKATEATDEKTVSTPEGRARGADQPVTTPKGKIRESRAYKNARERIQEEYQQDVNYRSLNIAEETGKALEFVTNNPEQAIRIAKGLEKPPEGFTDTAISIAAAEKAREDGNHKLHSQLESARSLRQTRRGQEIVMERGRLNEDSSHHYIAQVLKARLEQSAGIKGLVFETASKIAGKAKTKAEFAVQQIDEKARNLKKRIDKETFMRLESAQELLNNLTCKI